MKILYVITECKPFSKVGGVGDVGGELPPALRNEGVDIEIVTPFYGDIHLDQLPELSHQYSVKFHNRLETVIVYAGRLKNVRVNFIKNAHYFEGKYAAPYFYSKEIAFYDDIIRFSFFSEACLQLIQLKNPDIVHINDWPAGGLFASMAMEGLPQKRVLTIHNIGYQGNIGQQTIQGWHIEKFLKDKNIGRLFIDPRKMWKSVNLLKLALELAHMSNTVSPTYCSEITRPEDPDRFFEGGKGLHRITKRLYEKGKLIGILNGYDYQHGTTKKEYDQILKSKRVMKTAVCEQFQLQNAFLLGFVGRAVEQKFKLLTETLDGKSVLEYLLNEFPGLNVAILATGLPEYESFLRRLQHKNYPNLGVKIAFNKELARQISLASDAFLMPSLFEPCGITQMESLSNATPPLVRWTGGLVDTVRPYSANNSTGFAFNGAGRKKILFNLIDTVKEALTVYSSKPDVFRQMQKRAFKERFLWSGAAKQYIKEVYDPLLKAK